MTRHRSDITPAEIALAYELHRDGCCWKRIAIGLNCMADDISASVRNAMAHGISAHGRRPGGVRTVPIHALKAAKAMRDSRMGWKSISDHLFIDRLSLRVAFNYYYNLSSGQAIS